MQSKCPKCTTGFTAQEDEDLRIHCPICGFTSYPNWNIPEREKTEGRVQVNYVRNLGSLGRSQNGR